MYLVLVVLLVLLLVGAWPSLGFHALGYGPSGLIGVLLVVLVVLLLMGRL